MKTIKKEELKDKDCKPIPKGTLPMNQKEIANSVLTIPPGWQVIRLKKIRKKFPFENFKRGMAFAQEVALIAEQQNHHPDICIHYNNVEIELSTHDIGGLSENDFIMAAKIENI